MISTLEWCRMAGCDGSNFPEDLCNYARTVWPRTTTFGKVTHGDGRVSMGPAMLPPKELRGPSARGVPHSWRSQSWAEYAGNWSHRPGGRSRYCPPGLRLSSQPQIIIAVWSVPNYNAWCQRPEPFGRHAPTGMRALPSLAPYALRHHCGTVAGINLL